MTELHTVKSHPPALPGRTRAFWNERRCELVSYHAPIPVMTEYHHRKPVFLQNRLWGQIRFGPDLWVCSNCHDAVHAWLYYLLGMHRRPGQIGWLAKAEAERTYNWFVSEGGVTVDLR